jgi:hypothetical protein
MLLQLEGGCALILSLVAYRNLHGGWGWFALLILLPDISMLGYAFNGRVGVLLYNAAHTYLAPVFLGACLYLSGNHALLPYAIIWIAHIGFDRLLGFGLKYSRAFGDTHLTPARHAD